MRIAVVGCPGAGKSTLSHALGAILDVPVVHFDKLHWSTGWVELSTDETAQRIDAAVATDRWITDGNYTSYSGERNERADRIIWLDYPRRVCMRRVLKRITTSYGVVRSDMAEGCPEQFDAGFLKWVWNWGEHHRPAVLHRMQEDPEKWIWLRHPRHTTRWLQEVRCAGSV